MTTKTKLWIFGIFMLIPYIAFVLTPLHEPTAIGILRVYGAVWMGILLWALWTSLRRNKVI